jgi:glucose-6-phosphate isomerase
MTLINEPAVVAKDDVLTSESSVKIERKIKDLSDIFYDKKAFELIAPDTIVYEVESYFPVQANTEGGKTWFCAKVF